MHNRFPEFCELWNGNEIKIANIKLDRNLKNYSVYYITETFDFNHNENLIHNIKGTELMIINQCMEDISKKLFFIICIKASIIIINESALNTFNSILFDNPRFPIYFLFDTKRIFEKKDIKIENSQFDCDENFEDEIKNFTRSILFVINQKTIIIDNSITKNIKLILAVYLIKKGYAKLQKPKIIDFSNKFDINLSK